jgi:HEAT repeat protein
MSDDTCSKQLPPGFAEKDQAPGLSALSAGPAAVNVILLKAYLADLGSQSWRVRKKAANGLGALGAAAQEAVPQLEALLKDKDHRVKDAAALALERIGR